MFQGTIATFAWRNRGVIRRTPAKTEVAEQKFECRTFRIRSRNANRYTKEIGRHVENSCENSVL
jgi:hypothetical protein